MTTLENLIVNPALYQEVGGTEAQPGDQVRLYLDQVAIPSLPEYILGVIQNPILLTCAGTSYSVEYDETDLPVEVALLLPDMVISTEVVSEAEVLFANAVRFDSPQSLTYAQQSQALENIGGQSEFPTVIWPITEQALELVVPFTADTLNFAETYEYVGIHLGVDLYRIVGSTISTDGSTLSGSGGTLTQSGVPGELPIWYFSNIVEGVQTDVHATQVGTDYYTNPADVPLWNNGLIDVVVNMTYTSSVGYLDGRPGHVARVWVGSGFQLYMCYQVNPVRWKNLTEVPS